MSTKSILILTGITLVLGLYIVFFGWKDPGTKEYRDRQKMVFTLSGDTINRIEIVSTDDNILLVRQEDKNWAIEKPVSYPADQTLVQRVLSELEFSERVATLPLAQLNTTGDSMKQLGLDEPRIELKIRSDEHVYRLAIGNETAKPGNYYAQIKSGSTSELIVITKSIEDAVEPDLDAWRSKRIFEFITPRVTSLTLKSAGAETELTLESGKWLVKRPFSGMTEPVTVTSYLGGLLAARVDSFAPQDTAKLSEYGLNAPDAVLSISLGETSETLSIGNVVPEKQGLYYAQVSSRDAVFRVTEEFVGQINALLNHVRDKRILTQTLNHVKEVMISGGSAPLKLRHHGSSWNFDRDGAVAEQELLETFYTGLFDARGVDFLEKSAENLETFGVDDPEFTVSLSLKEDAPHEAGTNIVMRFSSIQDEHRYVNSDSVDFLVKVPAMSLPPFPQHRAEWLARDFSLPTEEIWKSLSWLVPQGKLSITRDENGAWPTSWNTRKLDLDFLKRQIKLLTSMKVIQRILISDKAADLREPELILNIRTNEGDSFKLTFSVAKERLVTVQVNDHEEGYVINEQDFQLLQVFPLDQSSSNEAE